jgi:hypothetical protein
VKASIEGGDISSNKEALIRALPGNCGLLVAIELTALTRCQSEKVCYTYLPQIEQKVLYAN